MDTVARMNEVIQTFKNTDSGYIGKAFEIVLREYIQPRSKRNNGKISKANTIYGDLRKNQNHKQMFIEIKTACGELGIITNAMSEEYMEENDIEQNISDFILPKATHVIYTPTVDLSYPLEKQAYIFNRDEFLAMVNNYNGKGLLRVKQSTNGLTVICFQSFYCDTRPKASKKMASYLQDCCNGQPTVEEYFTN